MNLYINNKPQELQGEPSIHNMLSSLGVTAQKGVAIAVNSNVIPQAEWQTHVLKEDDKIMLIKATQGG